jgi:hypothetical protein
VPASALERGDRLLGPHDIPPFRALFVIAKPIFLTKAPPLAEHLCRRQIRALVMVDHSLS